VTLVTLPYRSQLAAGQPEDIGMVLADFDAVLAVLNGDIRNDNIAAAAAIAASKLSGYPSDVTKALLGNGTWGTVGSGVTELTYVEDNTDKSITAVTAATANTLITAASFTADGGNYWLEYFCGKVYQDANMRQVIFRMYLDGVSTSDMGQIGANIGGGVTGNIYQPVYIKRKVTPAAGARVYSMRAYMTGGAGTSHADGTFGQWIRVTKGG
jgi:hypothetical protein